MRAAAAPARSGPAAGLVLAQCLYQAAAVTNIYPAVQRSSSLHNTRYPFRNVNISELYLAPLQLFLF